MKNFSDIQALLDRYWEGETTLEEERALKQYFNSGKVDERLKAVAPLFQVLQKEQVIQLPQVARTVALKPVQYSWSRMAAAASVALLLGAGAWWWSGHEKINSVVAQQSHTRSPEDTAQIHAPRTPALAAAVDAAPIAGSHPAFKKIIKKRKKTSVAPPDAETEQAMEEIKAALALVSSKIRKGKQEAARGAVHLETMDKVFKKRTEG